MLKCKIKDRKFAGGKINGTQPELTKETATLIHMVYHGIRKQSPELATEYKESLLFMLLDPDSPVWKTYEDEED